MKYVLSVYEALLQSFPPLAVCCNYWLISAFSASVRQIFTRGGDLSWLVLLFGESSRWARPCGRLLMQKITWVFWEFFGNQMHLDEDKLPSFDFSQIETQVRLHRSSEAQQHAFFIHILIMESSSSEIAVTYFVLNTPCIFHSQKMFLPTSFVEVWTQRIQGGSSVSPQSKKCKKLNFNHLFLDMHHSLFNQIIGKLNCKRFKVSGRALNAKQLKSL